MSFNYSINYLYYDKSHNSSKASYFSFGESQTRLSKPEHLHLLPCKKASIPRPYMEGLIRNILNDKLFWNIGGSR